MIADEQATGTAKAQIWDNTSSDDQRFKLVKNSDNTYTLLNVKSGKVLDVPNGVASSGQQLWQWEANGTNAQKWIIHQNGDGTFSLVSKLDGSLVIDVLNGDDKNGAVVQLWSYNATNAQKWRFSLVPDISVVSDYYTISSALAANQQVDVAGRSGENSAKIQLYVRNDSQAQKFKLVKNSDSSYTIINTSSGKALDIPDANAKSGAKLQQWASNGSDAQKWILYRHSDNKMTFVSKINQSLVIDVTSGSSSNGTALQLYPYNGTDAQKFSLSALPANDLINGSYVVTSNLNTKKVADIAGAAKSDGTQAQIWTTNDTLAQKFTFSQNADDSWTIANDNSGKAIDVSNANAYAGAKVQQWSLNATNAQKWIARKNSDGTYTFISKLASNLVLDVDNASTADGTRIKLYYDSGNSAQKWTLKRQ